MGRQIVKDDDIAWFEGGGELGFDISVEDRPVHWRVDHPGSHKSIASEACDQGLGAPMPKRRFGMKPLAFRATPAGFRHLGVG